jgi:hypothetical protein
MLPTPAPYYVLNVVLNIGAKVYARLRWLSISLAGDELMGSLRLHKTLDCLMPIADAISQTL